MLVILMLVKVVYTLLARLTVRILWNTASSTAAETGARNASLRYQHHTPPGPVFATALRSLRSHSLFQACGHSIRYWLSENLVRGSRIQSYQSDYKTRARGYYFSGYPLRVAVTTRTGA